MVKKALLSIIILVTSYLIFNQVKKVNFNNKYEVGQPIDSLNNVIVFFNGGVGNVVQRNTCDGYNLGLEYQCVEFVKRYYYENYNHKMPDSYGHAISFYDNSLTDNKMNKQRNLTQFSNPSQFKPAIGDLIVMRGTLLNKYGHVAIVSNLFMDKLEIIQQNAGPFSSSREIFELTKNNDGQWEIKNERILGWLRK
ncbi:CHAP domain-containing protein [Aureibaculum sp. A20]|uniref:CHAP domain-containing protein n=1 Tax=Aureibaculum flavum TaxID=2795986 RepID=A0ABS0WSQ4_9FLAO|nr:CHAP domain-containing protein [Aureibaculum flavum]MBJ2174951.1 CHAP domain-containing protein [Aureibaculum flavum]